MIVFAITIAALMIWPANRKVSGVSVSAPGRGIHQIRLKKISQSYASGQNREARIHNRQRPQVGLDPGHDEDHPDHDGR